MNTTTAMEAAQEAGVGKSREGQDLLYLPNERTFALSCRMFLENGWSIWPQEKTGRRMPARVNDKALSWGPYQERHATPEEVALWCKQAATSNVACALGAASGHTFAVDIDCLDEAVSLRVQALAFEHLGHTPLIRVGRAPKAALFYRYDELGSPRSRSVSFEGHPDCALEILGAGRAITLHGLHHVTGRWFTWPEMNPMTSPPEVAPEVGSLQVDRFLETVRKEFPFKVAATPAFTGAADLSTVSSEGIMVPSTKFDEKLADGRETYLRDLCWNTVRRNSAVITSADQDGTLNTARDSISAAVIEAFGERCELTGDWAKGGVVRQAQEKVARAVGKLLAGEMKPWVERAEKKDRVAKPAFTPPEDGRPVVRVVAGQMSETVDAAEAALMASDSGIYQRSGSLVRIGDAPVKNADGETRNARRILPLNEHSLGEVLGRTAAWTKYDARRECEVTADPPVAVVNTLMSRVGFWKLPVLAGVVSAPTLRADGSVAQEPGYDPETGLIFEVKERWNIPENPTQEQARVALAKLKELVSTFPFVSDADRSVALSVFLTAVIRRTLPTAPMHAFSAPAAGSGKSKLADIASLLVIGNRAPVVSIGTSEAETEKRLGSMLLAGDPVVAIDNVPEDTALGGDTLCQMLTQETIRIRILGLSMAPELPTGSLVTATGNNLKVLGDMTRRTLLCRIDPAVERPENREFDSDPVDVVMADRKTYVVAALTVLRAFQVAGRPKQVPRLGSFEVWSSRVRDALIWLGEADPVATMEVARASDPRLTAAVSVLTMWHAAVGDVRVSLKQVIDAAIKKDGNFEFSNPDLREALLIVASEGGAISSRRLGKYAAGLEGRIVAGLKLTKDALRDGVQTWKVERVGAAPAAYTEAVEAMAPKVKGKPSKARTEQDIEEAAQALLRSTDWRGRQTAMPKAVLAALAKREAAMGVTA